MGILDTLYGRKRPINLKLRQKRLAALLLIFRPNKGVMSFKLFSSRAIYPWSRPLIRSKAFNLNGNRLALFYGQNIIGI